MAKTVKAKLEQLYVPEINPNDATTIFRGRMGGKFGWHLRHNDSNGNVVTITFLGRTFNEAK